MSHHDWVLVTVRTPERPPQVICMTDSALESAIVAEHSLTNGPFWQSVSNIVSVGSQSGFLFKNPTAVAELPPPCDPGHLEAMRKALSSFTNEELVKHDFSAGPLEVSPPPGFSDEVDDRILSQVMIERGLRPFLECFSGCFTLRYSKGHNKASQVTSQ